MKDETIKKYIDMAVKRTIEELKKNGMIKEIDAAAYGDASEMLKTYFSGEDKDASIAYAIQALRFDPYYRIISMYYEEKRTLEEIADVLGVDVSTVVRNKKRLCMAIYDNVGG